MVCGSDLYPEYIVYALVTDHLGSVRFLVNLATGNVVQKITYDEYGNVLTNTGQDITPFFFAGGLYEEATGLTRFGARDYDAKTGRWTAKDPILFAGGTSNLYEYCLNDPVNSVDLDGLQRFSIESIKNTLEILNTSFETHQTIKNEYKNIVKINKINLNNYKIKQMDFATEVAIYNEILATQSLVVYGSNILSPKNLILASKHFDRALGLLEKYLQKKENKDCYEKKIQNQNKKGFWNSIWDYIFN